MCSIIFDYVYNKLQCYNLLLQCVKFSCSRLLSLKMLSRFCSCVAEPFLPLSKKSSHLSNPLPPNKKPTLLGWSLFGGRGWIRTTEAESSRFTVCPLWPLGNSPRYSFCLSEWSRQTDSNPRPADYKSAALPTELCRQLKQNTLIIAT